MHNPNGLGNETFEETAILRVLGENSTAVSTEPTSKCSQLVMAALPIRFVTIKTFADFDGQFLQQQLPHLKRDQKAVLCRFIQPKFGLNPRTQLQRLDGARALNELKPPTKQLKPPTQLKPKGNVQSIHNGPVYLSWLQPLL